MNHSSKQQKSDARHPDSAELNISAIDSMDEALIDEFYNQNILTPVLTAALDYIDKSVDNGLSLPYFAKMKKERWRQTPKALDIYITDDLEGRALNLEARGKDYPTNILSYPSDLPAGVIELMPTLPLGELIVCHDVIVREARKQDKAIAQHISHLLVHGVLHVLGFDHEIGQAEQDEMERFEIDILANLALPNPYV